MSLKKVKGKYVQISDIELVRRRNENKKYLIELKNDNLLLNYYFEAGLYKTDKIPDNIHGGWESPLCELRGHFLGHWLSAAAMLYEATGDIEMKAKADVIIHELARCQEANGGEWVASIPEKYLYRIADKAPVWAPQYTIHKTFMGLMDMYEKTGNEEALQIAVQFSKWFFHWVTSFAKEDFDDILDIETGGMLEIWAQLYGATKDQMYLTLLDFYYRRRLFDPLLKDKDVLTNMHANTTIPEVLGAARAYEETKDKKWLLIVEKYWDLAVTKRGSYATGGQNCGEIWTPIQKLNNRLGDKNQEHCTVYNMMRLADFLLRNTGKAIYADYWEQNLYNGIMAQGYWHGHFTHGKKATSPELGLLTYFLPLKAGSIKGWSSRTNDFFCCHGSLVQANAALNEGIYYQDDSSIYICQYMDSDAEINLQGKKIRIVQRIDSLTGSNHLSSTSNGSQQVNDTACRYSDNPRKLADYIYVDSERLDQFAINIRKPWWLAGTATIWINDIKVDVEVNDKGYFSITREWKDDKIYIEFPKNIQVLPLPGNERMVAFKDGPIVLAGLCDKEKTLYVDEEHPEEVLENDNEREWDIWKNTYHTIGQDENIRFIPLNEIGYESYTVYFPIKKK